MRMLTILRIQYLVMSYDNLVIQFYSAGIVEMLDPTNLAKGPLVGAEIFKFLARQTESMPRDYKGRVKSALKVGSAISLNLHLFTRRSMIFRGDECFATHWTPLKDEQSRVKWIVMTMGSMVMA